jgi:hypothetical protein
VRAAEISVLDADIGTGQGSAGVAGTWAVPQGDPGLERGCLAQVPEPLGPCARGQTPTFPGKDTFNPGT